MPRKYLENRIKELRKSVKKHRGDLRPGKRRYGLYLYLQDVYELYLDLRRRRISRKATRRYLKEQNLPIKRKSHPIRILIEASAGREDAKQKSRWTQALRNMYGWKLTPDRLDWFFGNNGGIAGAAREEAKKRAGNKRRRSNLPPIIPVLPNS